MIIEMKALKIRQKNLYVRLIVTIIMLACCGCASYGDVSVTPKGAVDAEKMLVLPWKSMVRLYGERKSVQSPLTDKYFITGMVSKNAERVLTQQTISQLNKRNDFVLVTPEQITTESLESISNHENRTSEKDLLVDIGRRSGVDAVVIGYIYRYEERIGTPQSVTSPAAVSFDVHVIDMKTGNMLWSAFYNETQTSLSENLFQLNEFIKRRGRWLTAREIAKSGLEQLFERLPNL